MPSARGKLAIAPDGCNGYIVKQQNKAVVNILLSIHRQHYIGNRVLMDFVSYEITFGIDKICFTFGIDKICFTFAIS